MIESLEPGISQKLTGGSEEQSTPQSSGHSCVPRPAEWQLSGELTPFTHVRKPGMLFHSHNESYTSVYAKYFSLFWTYYSD